MPCVKVRYLKPELKGTAPRIGNKESRHAATVLEEVSVEDARPAQEAGRLSLDTNGFVLVERPTRCLDFHDSKCIKQVYYAECEELVKWATGAASAFVTEHLVRTETPKGFSDGYARYVHLDYNEALASLVPQMFAQRMGIERRQAEEEYDFAFYNVWRPFDREVLQNPLALIDARTVSPDDVQDYIVAFRPHVPGAPEPRATIVSSNPQHRWSYFPRMQPSEALLFKQLDLRNGTGSRQCPHISFVDPAAPADAPGRRSVEVRLLAAFPRKGGARAARL